MFSPKVEGTTSFAEALRRSSHQPAAGGTRSKGVSAPSYPHISAGALRALGVSVAEYSSLLPKLPTVAESGYPRAQGFVPGRELSEAFQKRVAEDFVKFADVAKKAGIVPH